MLGLLAAEYGGGGPWEYGGCAAPGAACVWCVLWVACTGYGGFAALDCTGYGGFAALDCTGYGGLFTAAGCAAATEPAGFDAWLLTFHPIFRVFDDSTGAEGFGAGLA